MDSTRCSPRPNLPIGLLAALLGVLATPGCSTLHTLTPIPSSTDNPLIPTRHENRVGPFRIATNDPLPEDDPALRALAGLEARIDQALSIQVPDSTPPIDVYILDNDRAFTTFLTFHHPELPTRRAFFLASEQSRAIYTARGEHLEEDLRHEATHALLHHGPGTVPLWLDEGLAEYFEIVPRDLPAEASKRFEKLALAFRDGWRPDLRRLEAIEHVADMSPTDYREAWAWTFLLLHGSDRQRLVAFLDYRDEAPDLPPLSDWLGNDLDRLRDQFIVQVRRASHRFDSRVTRLQSPPPAPSARPEARVRSVRVVPIQPPSPPPSGLLGGIRRGLDRLSDWINPSP